MEAANILTTQETEPRIDVLICAGAHDVHHLLAYSLKSCIRNFELLNDIVIVTCAKRAVLKILEEHELWTAGVSITVLEDEEILSPALMAYPGWCKQQLIKLYADKVCKTAIIACLGADTIMCKPVTSMLLFNERIPILHYNRYSHASKHLIYERRRVEKVARILQVVPHRSWPLGDFIMDFMLFESARLQELRRYLESLYGGEAFLQIVPKMCDTLDQKVEFGEWTIYAIFLLDVLGLNMPIRNSNNRFIAQVHSAKEFDNFHFSAHVIHFVDKSFDRSRILSILESFGVV